ncbi:hypothetical protein BG000_000999, partial [Podila horticola]
MDVHVFVTQIKEFIHMDDDGKAASRFQPGVLADTQPPLDKDSLNKAMSNVPLVTLEKLLTDLSAPWAEVTRNYLEGCYFGDKGDRTHAYVFYAKAYMAFEEKSDWPLTHVALREAMEMAAERSNGGKPIPDSYIVVLKEGQSVSGFQNKFNSIARRHNGRGRKSTISRKYEAISGFAVNVNKAALKELLASDEIEFVEEDQIVTINAAQ